MSPVHVLVGDDPRAEQMWQTAFTGAVDLYRFDRNIDAFERLMVAEAPIDLVVLTPAQQGPFNLTPDQFVARILEGPLASSATLAGLHIIVVGSELSHQHPRAMRVSTLDAAIRLVKFGEVESTPRPLTGASKVTSVPVSNAPQAPINANAGGADIRMASGGDNSSFSSSVISSIWDAPRSNVVAGGGPALGRQARGPEVVHELATHAHSEPVQMQEVATQLTHNAQLFASASAEGFVVSGGAPTTLTLEPRAAAAMNVGAPSEAIEVSTGLQPARSYQLEGGGAYRGPAVRNGVVNAAAHNPAGGQPIPPALTAQVQSMVYGAVHVGNPHDPLLIWSSAIREAHEVPTQTQAPVQEAALQVGSQSQLRTVPLEPPSGVYGASTTGATPSQIPVAGQARQSHAAASDPFLARAEAQASSVSFG